MFGCIGKKRTIIRLNKKAVYNEFYKLCAVGKVSDVVSYARKYGLDIHHDNEKALVTACINKNVNVLTFIIYNTGNIDLTVNNNNIMKHLIVNAPTDMIDALHEATGVDLRFENDYLFFNRCFKDDVEKAQWLESKVPDYRIELSEDGKTIINYHKTKKGIPENDYLKALGIIKVKNTTKLVGDSCQVCMEFFNIVLPCGHTICTLCFDKWYYVNRNKSLCCVCKQYFRYDQCVYMASEDIPYRIEKLKNNDLPPTSGTPPPVSANVPIPPHRRYYPVTNVNNYYPTTIGTPAISATTRYMAPTLPPLENDSPEEIPLAIAVPPPPLVHIDVTPSAPPLPNMFS